MIGDAGHTTETPLYTYIVASGDMRYIAINQRNIFLRQEAETGLLLRGELPGCGAGCHADLAQIFLEYALTCEGCKTLQEAGEYVRSFGERLAEQLARQLMPEISGLPTEERLQRAFDLVVKSLKTPFHLERASESLRWILETCPLCESGEKSGLARELASARLGFAAFCARLLAVLAADWRLLSPSPAQAEQPLLEISLIKS